MTGDQRRAQGYHYTKDAFPIASMFDPVLGRDRVGMLIHGSSRADINKVISSGCVAIPSSEWPAFKQTLIAAQQKYGDLVLEVGADGKAKITPVGGYPKNNIVSPNMFIASTLANKTGVMNTQLQLRKMGLYDGPMDGIVGPKTAQALIAANEPRSPITPTYPNNAPELSEPVVSAARLASNFDPTHLPGQPDPGDTAYGSAAPWDVGSMLGGEGGDQLTHTPDQDRWYNNASPDIIADYPKISPQLARMPDMSPDQWGRHGTTGISLRLGDRGTSVSEMQSKLAALGYYRGPIDGVYGPLTAKAAAQFQHTTHPYSGRVDGVVGPKTQQALDATISRSGILNARNPMSPDYANYGPPDARTRGGPWDVGGLDLGISPRDFNARATPSPTPRPYHAADNGIEQYIAGEPFYPNQYWAPGRWGTADPNGPTFTPPGRPDNVGSDFSQGYGGPTPWETRETGTRGGADQSIFDAGPLSWGDPSWIGQGWNKLFGPTSPGADFMREFSRSTPGGAWELRGDPMQERTIDLSPDEYSWGRDMSGTVGDYPGNPELPGSEASALANSHAVTEAALTGHQFGDVSVSPGIRAATPLTTRPALTAARFDSPGLGMSTMHDYQQPDYAQEERDYMTQPGMFSPTAVFGGSGPVGTAVAAAGSTGTPSSTPGSSTSTPSSAPTSFSSTGSSPYDDHTSYSYPGNDYNTGYMP